MFTYNPSSRDRVVRTSKVILNYIMNLRPAWSETLPHKIKISMKYSQRIL